MSTESRKNFTRWCRRYISITLIAVVALMVFVLFLNDNSVVRTYQYQQEIGRLNDEIRAYTDTLNYYIEQNSRLETDRATMEKIVREQYRMQRLNEDVYIIE